MKKLDHRTLRYIANAYGKRMADGGDVDPNASDPNSSVDPSASSEEASMPPQGGYDGSPYPNPNVPISEGAMAEAGMKPEDLDSVAPADPNATAEAVPTDSPAFPAAVTAPAAAPDQKPDPFAQAGVPNMEAAFQEEKSATTAKARAEADQGQAEADALHAAQVAISKLPSANDITSSYKQKDDALFKAYQSKTIDPNRYLHNQSTGQRILSGLALILSGAGAGVTGQPNLAAKMIEQSINNDIQAQKNSQDQSMNLWKLNKEEYGNDLAANLATQSQILTGTKAQLAEVASSAKGPIAQANAQAANALIDQKLAENRFKLSLMQPTSDSFGLDPAKKVSWLVPAEKQNKVFDEIGAAQETTKNAPAIIDAFDKAAAEVRPLTGGTHTSMTAFVPGIESANQKAMHALLGPTFKDVEGTVRQAAMDNMFKNTTPQFGDNAQTIATKRNALIGYMTSKTAAPTASGFGINLNQYPSTNVHAAIPRGQQSQSRGPEIRYDAQGKAWMRDAQGNIVPANTPAKAPAKPAIARRAP